MIQAKRPTKRLPPLFVDVEHYFQWCDLQEKQWRERVARNPKAQAVNRKLEQWRREHPVVISLAEWRLERVRRKAKRAI